MLTPKVGNMKKQPEIGNKHNKFRNLSPTRPLVKLKISHVSILLLTEILDKFASLLWEASQTIHHAEKTSFCKDELIHIIHIELQLILLIYC